MNVQLHYRRLLIALASLCLASFTFISWARISSSLTDILHIRGWPGLMKAEGFLSRESVSDVWPVAGSLEMWRWVEILANNIWFVIPGPVDLIEDGSVIFETLVESSSSFSSSSSLTSSLDDCLLMLRGASLLVQNSCRGFSRDTCLSSAFTLDLWSL